MVRLSRIRWDGRLLMISGLHRITPSRTPSHRCVVTFITSILPLSRLAFTIFPLFLLAEKSKSCWPILVNFFLSSTIYRIWWWCRSQLKMCSNAGVRKVIHPESGACAPESPLCKWKHTTDRIMIKFRILSKFYFHSMLRRCWLGDRKAIRTVKMLGVGLSVVMISLEFCMSSSCHHHFCHP